MMTGGPCWFGDGGVSGDGGVNGDGGVSGDGERFRMFDACVYYSELWLVKQSKH